MSSHDVLCDGKVCPRQLWHTGQKRQKGDTQGAQQQSVGTHQAASQQVESLIRRGW